MELSIDREKVIKGWECHMGAGTLGCAGCPYREGWRTCNFEDTLYKDVYALLNEQEDEKKRVMKVIWDTLHEGFSIDTVPDQDWVYEQIRHRIEDKDTQEENA